MFRPSYYSPPSHDFDGSYSSSISSSSNINHPEWIKNCAITCLEQTCGSWSPRCHLYIRHYLNTLPKLLHHGLLLNLLANSFLLVVSWPISYGWFIAALCLCCITVFVLWMLNQQTLAYRIRSFAVPTDFVSGVGVGCLIGAAILTLIMNWCAYSFMHSRSCRLVNNNNNENDATTTSTTNPNSNNSSFSSWYNCNQFINEITVVWWWSCIVLWITIMNIILFVSSRHELTNQAGRGGGGDGGGGAYGLQMYSSRSSYSPIGNSDNSGSTTTTSTIDGLIQPKLQHHQRPAQHAYPSNNPSLPHRHHDRIPSNDVDDVGPISIDDIRDIYAEHSNRYFHHSHPSRNATGTTSLTTSMVGATTTTSLSSSRSTSTTSTKSTTPSSNQYRQQYQARDTSSQNSVDRETDDDDNDDDDDDDDDEEEDDDDNDDEEEDDDDDNDDEDDEKSSTSSSTRESHP